MVGGATLRAVNVQASLINNSSYRHFNCNSYPLVTQHGATPVWVCCAVQMTHARLHVERWQCGIHPMILQSLCLTTYLGAGWVGLAAEQEEEEKLRNRHVFMPCSCLSSWRYYGLTYVLAVFTA